MKKILIVSSIALSTQLSAKNPELVFSCDSVATNYKVEVKDGAHSQFRVEKQTVLRVSKGDSALTVQGSINSVVYDEQREVVSTTPVSSFDVEFPLAVDASSAGCLLASGKFAVYCAKFTEYEIFGKPERIYAGELSVSDFEKADLLQFSPIDGQLHTYDLSAVEFSLHDLQGVKAYDAQGSLIVDASPFKGAANHIAVRIPRNHCQLGN